MRTRTYVIQKQTEVSGRREYVAQRRVRAQSYLSALHILGARSPKLRTENSGIRYYDSDNGWLWLIAIQ